MPPRPSGRSSAKRPAKRWIMVKPAGIERDAVHHVAPHRRKAGHSLPQAVQQDRTVGARPTKDESEPDPGNPKGLVARPRDALVRSAGRNGSMMRTRFTLALVASALAAGLFVPGCGGGDNGNN